MGIGERFGRMMGWSKDGGAPAQESQNKQESVQNAKNSEAEMVKTFNPGIRSESTMPQEATEISEEQAHKRGTAPAAESWQKYADAGVEEEEEQDMAAK